MLAPCLPGWVPEGTPDGTKQLGEKCGWREAEWGLQMDGPLPLGEPGREKAGGRSGDT